MDFVAVEQNLLQINIPVSACASCKFPRLTESNDSEGRSFLGCCFKEKTAEEIIHCV